MEFLALKQHINEKEEQILGLNKKIKELENQNIPLSANYEVMKN